MAIVMGLITSPVAPAQFLREKAFHHILSLESHFSQDFKEKDKGKRESGRMESTHRFLYKCLVQVTFNTNVSPHTKIRWSLIFLSQRDN